MKSKSLKELNEEASRVLEPLNEMSIAWDADLKGNESVCAWVEGPLKVDNQYIKYYNNAHYPLATKVARIRIDKPEYVGGIHSEGNKKKWILTNSEKRTLVHLLNQASEKDEKYTNWQQVILEYNASNFRLFKPVTGDMTIYKDRKAPTMPEYILPFPIDYPMPNYMEL